MYLLVENFNQGLDTRRMYLTAKAGSLQKLKNAHITRGGEIEKRLAFATHATIPAGTFGLQAAGGSLYVFGSGPQPAGFPANLNYQRLAIPSGQAMTELVFSETFNGKIYSIAKYADGSVHHFFDAVATNVPSSSFAISSVNPAYSFTSITVGTVEVLGSTVAMSSSQADTASRLVTAINAYSATSGGFTAATFTPDGSASAIGIKITAPIGSSGLYSGATLAFVSGGYVSVAPIPQMTSEPRVTAWDTIASSVGDNSAVAAALATQIEASAPFTAFSTGAVITITNVTPNQSFTFSGTATNGGSNNNQTITFATTQTATAATSATSSFTVTGSAITGSVTAVTINGSNVLSGTVTGTSTTTATATAIAAAITVGGYSASASGATVTITAPSGAAANGFTPTISVAGTGLTVGAASALSGGADARPQITTATIGGTFELNDVFSITLTVSALSFTQTFQIASSASGVGNTARTFGNKLYSTTRSLLYFSEISDPTKFGTNVNGSGFINLSNQDSGFEDLQALGIYQGKMAIFSRRAVQIWTMDADPTKNTSSQTLKNIGTFAPRSVTNFGDIDVFFLSDTGVRSLRARDASNAATVSDVGTNIDTLIQSDLLALPESTKNSAFGIIEPTDGRYWLAIGSKIYVYSFFPSANIAAWSTYEPGFTISHFAYANGRIYARSGNTVYLYGGASGNEYDNSQVEVILPYLDAGKPAHTKTLQAIDMTCVGTWDVFVGCDTTVPEARDHIATVNKPTFDLARIQAAGMGTHIGVRLVTSSSYSGAAKIGNFASHFEINDAG